MSKASFQWNHCPPGQRPPDYICIGEIPKANGPEQTRAAGAAVPGQSSQVRGPAAEAVSAAPGPDQAPRRPQHDPPRRSGTVGASLFPSSIAWAPGSKRLFRQPRNLAKGLQICRKTVAVGLRSRALSWSNFQARKMQSLTHFEFSLPGNVWFVNTYLVSGKRAGRTCREGPWTNESTAARNCAKWEPAWARPVVAGYCELCLPGAARWLGVLFITCWTRALQEGWGFLKPSVSVLLSGILHLSPKEIESSGRWREPLPHGRVPPRQLHKGKMLIGMHRPAQPVSRPFVLNYLNKPFKWIWLILDKR